jgi:hypothetical protein
MLAVGKNWDMTPIGDSSSPITLPNLEKARMRADSFSATILGVSGLSVLHPPVPRGTAAGAGLENKIELLAGKPKLL